MSNELVRKLDGKLRLPNALSLRCTIGKAGKYDNAVSLCCEDFAVSRLGIEGKEDSMCW